MGKFRQLCITTTTISSSSSTGAVVAATALGSSTLRIGSGSYATNSMLHRSKSGWLASTTIDNTVGGSMVVGVGVHSPRRQSSSSHTHGNPGQWLLHDPLVPSY